MADPYPKTYDELVAENAAHRATIARLESSVSSLQATVVFRDSELAQTRKPKAAPRTLDLNATDVFRRPAYSGRR